MAQVSNETELASALAGTDSSIQLTADISVTAVLKVQRDITLSSLSPRYLYADQSSLPFR